jgi:hypothetical protein
MEKGLDSHIYSDSEFFGKLEEKREACKERGYHVVDSENDNLDGFMICYECDLWFGKDQDVNYKVRPL